jgi:hypothetical protein
MLSFRRNVLERLMNMRYDLIAIMEDVSLVEEEDHLLWSFNSSGKYSVQSLYDVITQGLFVYSNPSGLERDQRGF